MSYDLEVWSANAAVPSDALPSPEKWTRHDGIWVHPGAGWQIVIDDPIEIDAEDVPEQIESMLPGIACLTRIAVEPGDAPKIAHQILQRSARHLAKAGHGIIYDPQVDSVTLGTAVKRFSPPGRDRQDEKLMLSWWFGPEPLAERAGFQELVKLLRRLMPEVLPRRYGTFEPPEYRLSDSGDAHLVEFLHTEGRQFMPVLFPHRPVKSFSMHLPDKVGYSPGWSGFRANLISIEVLAAALQQPGWELQIRRLWREMSEFLQPFYGDARFVVGVEPHPVRAWFWRGFPTTSGVASVIGEPYLDRWPEAAQARSRRGGLAYFGGETLSSSTDIYSNIGCVPDTLVNPNTNYWGVDLYPPCWPFEPPA